MPLSLPTGGERGNWGLWDRNWQSEDQFHYNIGLSALVDDLGQALTAIRRLPQLAVDHVSLDGLLAQMWVIRAAIGAYNAPYVALAATRDPTLGDLGRQACPHRDRLLSSRVGRMAAGSDRPHPRPSVP